MDAGTKKGCLAGCLVSVAAAVVLTLLFVALVAFAFRGCVSETSWRGAKSALPADASEMTPLDESPFRKVCLSATGPEAAVQVLKIDLHGIIDGEKRHAFLFDDAADTSAATALRKIRAATKDDTIRGLYLDVDTPGGGVTASDELHDAICRFRASDTNRFVFVHMGDLCCSGGYYVSAPATWIMARPTTTTGSIGVIISGVNAEELAQKIGLKPVTIASGGNKALLHPLEPVNPEHVKILEEVVRQMHERFVEIVAEGRGLSLEKVRELADGRVFSAKDACERGLIDSIGHDADARGQLCKLAGGDVRICAYRDKTNFWSFFGDALMFESVGRLLRKADAMAGGDSAPRAGYLMK